jgi:hypothetical protein
MELLSVCLWTTKPGILSSGSLIFIGQRLQFAGNVGRPYPRVRNAGDHGILHAHQKSKPPYKHRDASRRQYENVSASKLPEE